MPGLDAERKPDPDRERRPRDEERPQSAPDPEPHREHLPRGAENVLLLQGSVGNRAVTQLLTRDRGGAGGTRTPAKPRERDPTKMTEEEIQAELDRNLRQQERVADDRARWTQLFERMQRLNEELERRAKAEEDAAFIRGSKESARRLVADAARMQTRFTEEIRFATVALDSVGGRLNRYLTDYSAAHERFVGVLEKAKLARAERRKRDETIAGIMLGVGLGVTAGAIFHAAKGAYRVVVEAATEVLEAGATKLAPTPSDDVFTPPATLDPKLRSGPAMERLMDAWKGLGRFNFTTLAFGQLQLELQKIEFNLERNPTMEAAQAVYRLMVKGHMQGIGGKLDELHASIDEFWNLMAYHPLLQRSQRELEQDMWVLVDSCAPEGRGEDRRGPRRGRHRGIPGGPRSDRRRRPPGRRLRVEHGQGRHERRVQAGAAREDAARAGRARGQHELRLDVQRRGGLASWQPLREGGSQGTGGRRHRRLLQGHPP